jgi:hypothetical protein
LSPVALLFVIAFSEVPRRGSSSEALTSDPFERCRGPWQADLEVAHVEQALGGKTEATAA